MSPGSQRIERAAAARRSLFGRDRQRRALRDLGRAGRRRAHQIALRIDLDLHLDAVRRRSRRDDAVGRLAPDARDIVRRRIDDDALDDVAHERERNADRRDHLRIARDAPAAIPSLGGKRDDRPRAAAAAHDDHVIAVERVVGDQFVDAGAQLARARYPVFAARAIPRRRRSAAPAARTPAAPIPRCRARTRRSGRRRAGWPRRSA